MISVGGFCDLNVSLASGQKDFVINTCQKLFEFGYQTIALNTICEESIFQANKNKKKDGKKDENKKVNKDEKQGDLFPEPDNMDIIKHFQGRLKIYTRLTVPIADSLEAHKLQQSANAKKYNILAVTPTSQAAFQHVCSTMDVDIIAYKPEDVGVHKFNRKTYNLAVSRGIFFEITYAPAIMNFNVRRNIIQMAHNYHTYGKSKNIIISSGASNPLYVRGPYDIINLGLLFGLSEEQAKGAISSVSRHLLLKAAGRRLGKTVVIASKNKSVADENMEVELPNQKRLRQE